MNPRCPYSSVCRQPCASGGPFPKWNVTSPFASGGSRVIATYCACEIDAMVRESTSFTKEVRVPGDFTTLKGAVDWLRTNMTEPTMIRVESGCYPVADTIHFNLPHACSILGAGFDITRFYPASGLEGKPMLVVDGNQSVGFGRCDFTDACPSSIAWGNVAGEDAFVVSPSSDMFMQLQDCGLYCGNIGMNVQKDCYVWLFNSVVDGCVAKDIEINNTTGTATIFRVAECDFNGASIIIDLVKCSGLTFDAEACNFVILDPSNIVIRKPDSNDVLFDECGIRGNYWNQVGTFLSGFDFTTTRDAGICVLSNVGVDNNSPHASVVCLNNGSDQALTDMFSKSNFTNNCASHKCKFELTDNKFKCISPHDVRVIMTVNGNVQSASPNETYEVGIVKNGVISVSGVTNNGSGKVRCASPDTKGLENGDTVFIDFTATYADGYYMVSSVTGSSFDVTSLAYAASTTASAVNIYGATTSRLLTKDLPYAFGTSGQIHISENDYLEIFIRDASGTSNGHIQDASVVVSSL